MPSSTRRPPVRLPSLTTETVAAKKYKPITMARAHLKGDELVFANNNGFDQARTQGFFLLEMPPYIDFEHGDKFVSHFYKPTESGPMQSYTGFKLCQVPGDYQGYFDREHDQWENFYIERHNWSLLPPEVALLGEYMARIGIYILRTVLYHVGIPHHMWPLVTGNLSEHLGHQMLAFNHFRADKAVRGSKFHRDSGWVTVLRSTEPGLLAYIDNTLVAINPEPNHLIINFGSSLEVLTEELPIKIHANVHGVVQTERQHQHDRVSYAMFLDSHLAGSIYKYGPDGPRRVQSVAEFAQQEVSRTYDDNNGAL